MNAFRWSRCLYLWYFALQGHTKTAAAVDAVATGTATAVGYTIHKENLLWKIKLMYRKNLIHFVVGVVLCLYYHHKLKKFTCSLGDSLRILLRRTIEKNKNKIIKQNWLIYCIIFLMLIKHVLWRLIKSIFFVIKCNVRFIF